MAIDVNCPSCGKGYALADSMAGTRARCACGVTFDVPGSPDATDVYDFTEAAPPPFPKPVAKRPKASPPPPTAPVPRPPTARPSQTWKIVAGAVALVMMIVVIAVFQQAKRRQAAEADPTFRPLVPVASGAWPTDAPWKSRGGIREMRLDVPNAAGLRTQLVIFLPAEASSGARVPCVFVAPAGSRMFHGMSLARGDEDEALPYVTAGMGAILYSIGGPLDDADLEKPLVARGAFRTFRLSQGGLADAEAAIEYALARRKEIDPSRLYVAGHSSAASLSLLVAAKDDRVKGCCAYAPATDLIARNSAHLSELEGYLPGFERFSHDISPVNLPVPRGRVFLFSAEDDDNVPTADVRRYAQKLGPSARLMIVPKGGHYESMVRDGLPEGVRFLRSLANAAAPR